MVGKCPCGDCGNRKIGCHGKCHEYGDWKKRITQAKWDAHDKNNQYTNKLAQPFWRRMNRIYG